MAKFETKYYIDGKDLKSFCKNHDYSYSSARNMIASNKKKHPEWTTEEILTDVKRRLEKGKTKYFFGDLTLNMYCSKNGIVSSTVRRKYNRMRVNPKYRGLNNDKIMQMALEESKMGHDKYRVDGILLSVYCRLNEINRGTIINKINQYKKKHPNSGLSDDEIAKMTIINYYKGHDIYYVENKSLHVFVTNLGYLPSTVLRKMHSMYPETIPSKTRKKIIISEEKLLNVLSSIGKVNGTLYFYGGMSLRQYCKNNNINYVSIMKTISNHSELSIDEIVTRAISNMNKRIRQKDRITLKSRTQDEEFINFYIEKYGIDREQFNLARKHFGVFESISIIEYFGTVNDEIILMIKNLLQNNENSFDDAIMLNSLGFNDRAYYVVKGLEGMINNTIKSLDISKSMYVSYREYLEEFIYNIIVDKCYLFTPGELISYLKKTMKPRLIKHLQEEYMQGISLDDSIGSNISTSETQSIGEKIDAIRKSLEDLNEWELEFIYRRFGFHSSPMSIVDLQKIYYSDHSVNELKSLETAILYKLKNSDNLKKLVL